MRKWKGLQVPVEPEKSWKWMKDHDESCCGDEIPCFGTCCEDCIYSRIHADARASFYTATFEKEEKMFEWAGLKVPADPQREWGEWMCSEDGCPGSGKTMGCIGVCDCADCIYSKRHYEERKCFYEQWYGKWPQTPPKLTVEVFNRPDCPEWAQWAAVDANGFGYLYDTKPYVGNERKWYTRAPYEEFVTCGKFDAFDWEHSLIQRPAKELPKLTQTAFHCPDCPKEAATLKVFPANHVVALDKDDKVLSVMELQCQEGEINKPEWFYSFNTFKLYRKDDYRRDIPKDAVPVLVHYLSPSQLIGKAVTNDKTGKNYLVAEVNGLTVTLQGVDKKELLSMPTLVQFYSFVDAKNFCCSFETLP